MISLRPGPHSPKLGPKVYSKVPNYKFGYSIHKQGFGIYRVVAWFDTRDGTRSYQLHTKVGYWNARDQGDLSISDLVMKFWPQSDTLTKEIAVIVKGQHI